MPFAVLLLYHLIRQPAIERLSFSYLTGRIIQKINVKMRAYYLELRMNIVDIKYPFKPKTNNSLIPGQFWAIPLMNGQFACGRVIQVTKLYEGLPTKSLFLAGLMNWLGEAPPNSEDIAGKKTIFQGVAHIKTIHETGLEEMITGFRPLELDSIEVDYFRSQEGYHPEHCKLIKGLNELRPITKSEWEKYPTLGIWGTEFIRALAERWLLR